MSATIKSDTTVSEEERLKTQDSSIQQEAGLPAPAGIVNAGSPVIPPAVTDDPGASYRALAAAASPNPALVEFPADPWGFTSDLRKYGLRVASNVSGQRDKNFILLGTLMVLMGHVKNRYKADKEAFDKEKDQQIETLAEAEKYTRQFGVPYNPEDAVRHAMNVVAEAKRSGQYKDITG